MLTSLQAEGPAPSAQTRTRHAYDVALFSGSPSYSTFTESLRRHPAGVPREVFAGGQSVTACGDLHLVRSLRGVAPVGLERPAEPGVQGVDSDGRVEVLDRRVGDGQGDGGDGLSSRPRRWSARRLGRRQARRLPRGEARPRTRSRPGATGEDDETKGGMPTRVSPHLQRFNQPNRRGRVCRAPHRWPEPVTGTRMRRAHRSGWFKGQLALWRPMTDLVVLNLAVARAPAAEPPRRVGTAHHRGHGRWERGEYELGFDVGRSARVLSGAKRRAHMRGVLERHRREPPSQAGRPSEPAPTPARGQLSVGVGHEDVRL